MFRIEGSRLPTSAEVASALLEAAENHRVLQSQYIEVWAKVQVGEMNDEVARLDAVEQAYVSGRIDGKNKERRDHQLAAEVMADQTYRRANSVLHDAQRLLKLVEVSLESARVYRGALHDIKDLVVAEKLAEANRGLSFLYGWGQE